jgi:hypothetical protein
VKAALYIFGGLAVLALIYWVATRSSGVRYTPTVGTGGGPLSFIDSITAAVTKVKALISSVSGSPSPSTTAPTAPADDLGYA